MKEGSICNKCNHRAYCDMGDEHNNDSVTIKGCYLYSEQKGKTNADRIRSMTDEELEKWFTSVCTAKSTCSCMDCAFDTFMDCGFGDWLKQEAE